MKLSKYDAIAVLGCGWLGLPLAHSFKKIFKKVKGSTTQESKIASLKNKGIAAFKVVIDDHLFELDESFLEVNTLVISIPSRIQKKNHEAVVRLINLIEKSDIRNVIYISSTGVYANNKGKVHEKDNCFDANKSELIHFEELFSNISNTNCSIIRFGGLIDKDRHPGTFFQKKQTEVCGNAPVNLIHRKDCIGIIHHLIKYDFWGEIINGVCPHHPSKKAFYTYAIEKKGGKLPTFIEDPSQNKLVSADKLLIDWEYRFEYENLYRMIDDLQ